MFPPESVTPACSRRPATVTSPSQHLYEFAVELRRLAYTMPGGYEDLLVRLSERMVGWAREQVARQP